MFTDYCHIQGLAQDRLIVTVTVAHLCCEQACKFAKVHILIGMYGALSREVKLPLWPTDAVSRLVDFFECSELPKCLKFP